VLDLHVPAGASSVDVATEYSRQANLPFVPMIYTRLGHPVAPDVTLARAGITSGGVLVALRADQGPVVTRRQTAPVAAELPGPLAARLSTLWLCLAVAGAALSGWLAAQLPTSSDLRAVTIALLIGAAVVGALPVGPRAAHRVLAVPAFAGAAAFVIAWDPAPERLPTILGVACLSAAVAAVVARALDRHAEEGLRVWAIVGVGVFVVAAVAALAGADAQVVWAILLLVAMLSARFVPMIAVEVPDQYLLDVERLAVTAWSARDRPVGRRGRIIVPRQAVALVAASGTRMVTAACVAILVVSATAAALLLREASLPVDRIGARCEVGLAGAALLLAARSYRHSAARALLCVAGLACWTTLAVALFSMANSSLTTTLAGTAIGLGALLMVAAVALGRGWRSAWWARRAEVAESACGAFAVGSLVLASGLFGALWALTG